MNWQASQRDVAVPRTISYYDIWRAVDTLPFNMTVGASSVITSLKDVREDTKGPLYYASLATSSSPPYYWELVGTQSAHGFGGYTFSAPTREDSVATGVHNEVFMVSGFNAAYVAYQRRHWPLRGQSCSGRTNDADHCGVRGRAPQVEWRAVKDLRTTRCIARHRRASHRFR